MQLGMIGLGRMGANMAERLVHGSHEVVGYDRDREAVSRAVPRGLVAASTLSELIERLTPPRIVWLMVPAGDPVDRTLEALFPLLAAGDIIVDGGNSYYKHTMRRAEQATRDGFHYVDVGTSGGIWGLKEGYSMMVGGEPAVVEHLTPILATLAPAPDRGWGRVGPGGAGHFVKMVHNGIEYGLMQSFAEGFAVLRARKEFALDLHQVAGIWQSGSVIRSWLLDLIADALAGDPTLAGVAPYVEDSGEGRWTVAEAMELDVPTPVIALSLLERFRSRDREAFYDRMLAALRHEFGGHAVHQEP